MKSQCSVSNQYRKNSAFYHLGEYIPIVNMLEGGAGRPTSQNYSIFFLTLFDIFSVQCRGHALEVDNGNQEPRPSEYYQRM